MVVVTLVREGINKHKARELADHFAAQPEQEPLGWLDGNDKLAQFMHRDLKADHDKRGSATPREYTIPVYAATPQRPWLSLTGAEIDANEILRYHFSLNNGPVTRAGMAVVDTVTALLKAKNRG
jgi:hypothetical protein